MVRVKIVLDVTYLGTRFCGWQAQNPPLTAEGNRNDDLPGPCQRYNRGRCARGDGCRAETELANRTHYVRAAVLCLQNKIPLCRRSSTWLSAVPGTH